MYSDWKISINSSTNLYHASTGYGLLSNDNFCLCFDSLLTNYQCYKFALFQNLVKECNVLSVWYYTCINVPCSWRNIYFISPEIVSITLISSSIAFFRTPLASLKLMMTLLFLVRQMESCRKRWRNKQGSSTRIKNE